MEITHLPLECLTAWIKACNEYHGSSCVPAPNQTKQPNQIPKWVVDIDEACLVSGTTVPRYTALSYTWGQLANEEDTGAKRLLLKSSNLRQFQERRSLDHTGILERLPTVVRETMDLLKAIGERYLWVDCLCVCQGDASKNAQAEVPLDLEFMDEIYSGAYLTIIAAASSGLYYGRKCYEATGKKWEQFQMHKDLEYRLLNTRWASRGWTFQEHLLSKRAMVFLGEGEVFWDCNLCVWDPETPSATLEKMVDLSKMRSKYFELFEFGKTLDMGCRLSKLCWPDMDLYRELARLYNSRDLTYPQDALPAFSGVLRSLSKGFVGGFVHGLPKLFLDTALLWQPRRGSATRRIHRPQGQVSMTHQTALPSWSWCGWQCVLDRNTMLTDAPWSVWTIRNPVEWSLVSENRESEARLPEQEFLAEYKSLAADSNTRPFPGGWVREKENYENAQYYFKHELITVRQFVHPLPLVDRASTETPSAESDWPFLSCQTTHATLRVRCILRPDKKTVEQKNAIELHSMLEGFSVPAEPLVQLAGPDDAFSVAVLEDPHHGRWAGVLRIVPVVRSTGAQGDECADEERAPLVPGQSIQVVALSRGSVSLRNLLGNAHGRGDAPDLADEGVDYREWAEFGSEGENNSKYTQTRVRYRRDFGGSAGGPSTSSHAVVEWPTTTSSINSTSSGLLNAPIHFIDNGPSPRWGEFGGSTDGQTDYCFCNVLCVEQKGDIHYRIAAGRVKEAVWEDVCSEPTKIMLG